MMKTRLLHQTYSLSMGVVPVWGLTMWKVSPSFITRCLSAVPG